MIARRLLPVIAVAACMVFLRPVVAQTAPVTVYCSALAQWCEIMRQAFETKTGIKALMTVKSTGETLAQLRAEAGNPRADIWWAGTSDPHLEAAKSGLTQVYKSPALDKLQPWARRQAELSDYKSVGIYAGTIGIVWHRDNLKKKNLPEPKCWADLVKPAYKDEIQMSNPGTSGTSYLILATLMQIMGEDKAFEYLKALNKNVNQYPRSGAAPMHAVVQGESVLAVTFVFAAIGEAASGAPVAAISPCEGTGYEIGSMSIINGAKNLEGAKAWYEFALTPEAQATGVKGRSYQIPSHLDAPLPPGTPRLEDVKLIDYDFKRFGAPGTSKQLIARFERDILSQPK